MFARSTASTAETMTSSSLIHPEVCIDCGACVSACPVEAIHAYSDVPDKWGKYVQINAEFFKKV